MALYKISGGEDTALWRCETDVIAVVCVRNEMARLPHFIEHHRKTGVKGFVFIDNESTDGTVEYLSGQTRSIVYKAEGSYAASYCGVKWLNEVLAREAKGRWVLIVDADELFIYPRYESKSISDVAAYCDRNKKNAMCAFMLDMYGSGSIGDTKYTPPEPFIQVCPYFDSDTYQYAKSGPFAGLPQRGGVRRRIFWENPDAPGNPPVLAKVPLLRWSHGMELIASTHKVAGIDPCNATGVLLHFKMFSDMENSARIESERAEHWDSAAQYKSYLEGFRSSGDITPLYPGSTRFKNSRQLVDMGFMREPKDFP